MTLSDRLIHQSTDESMKQNLVSIYRNAEDMLNLINQNTGEITPAGITAASLDDELIKKALPVVEKNMNKSGYSVNELASELALSRRQLSRRFRSIIGMAPAEFICFVRLKRAAQLLKESQYNISEISDKVGFSTIRSFNRNFKEKFGVTPTQYRAESI